ncbi:hypothetical protein ScPMuIL_008827 [Solemya velum]
MTSNQKYNIHQEYDIQSGTHYWTVGQRALIGGLRHAYFVVDVCPDTRTVTVAPGTDHSALFTDYFHTDLRTGYTDPQSDFSHSLPRSSNSIDSDDEEEGYFQPRDTNPPVPAEIPPVLISVPDDIHEVAADHDTNQPSASEPAVHVPSTLPQANRDVSSPPVHGSGEHARPKRARKLPKYLEDYVT